MCDSGLFSLLPDPKCSFFGQLLLRSVIVSFLSVLLTACSDSPDYPYEYPTSEYLKVQEACALIYEPQYRGILGTALKLSVRQIYAIENGLQVAFTNGITRILPIPTDLPLGKGYSCSSRPYEGPCSPLGNQDPHCQRPSRTPVQRLSN